jgi:hypothetical protein
VTYLHMSGAQIKLTRLEAWFVADSVTADSTVRDASERARLTSQFIDSVPTHDVSFRPVISLSCL